MNIMVEICFIDPGHPRYGQILTMNKDEFLSKFPDGADILADRMPYAYGCEFDADEEQEND
jgi:hypothetical protein